nr:3'-5' exonuclease [Capnocytophaga sp. oral taxon 878]
MLANSYFIITFAVLDRCTMDNFVALDFETANYNQSSVCSVGVVFVINKQITDTYYELIKPAPNYYNAINTQIHGLTRRDTDGARIFPDIWAELLPKIGELPIVAHNSPFDEGCLRAVLAYYGLPPYGRKFLCTCRQARKVLTGLPNHKLATVARHIGFDLEHHHHALADAEACAAIALEVF